MKTVSWLILLVSLCSFSKDTFAKRLKRYRVKITHYDNSALKGIIYDVTEKGIGLIATDNVSYLTQSMIVKDVMEGKIQVTHIPFNQIKNVTVRRKGSVGRGALIGSLGAFALTAAITITVASVKKNDSHCGCGGPPAALVLPPIAALGGGIVGILAGFVPKKIVVLEPEKLFESAKIKLLKYSIYAQIE